MRITLYLKDELERTYLNMTKRLSREMGYEVSETNLIRAALRVGAKHKDEMFKEVHNETIYPKKKKR